MVVAGLGFFGPSSTVVGLEVAARAEGYGILLASLPEVTPEATQEALEHLVDESVEAIVLIAPTTRASIWASADPVRSRSWCSTRTRFVPAWRSAWTMKPARGWPPST